MNLSEFKYFKKHNINYNYPNNKNQTFSIDTNHLNGKNSTIKEVYNLKNSFPNKNKYSNIYSKKYNISLDSKFNSTFPNFFQNDYKSEIQKDYFPPSNISLLENELKSLKLDYISLNNDNIIFREDIYKLVALNNQLEHCLKEERSHNNELAKENDIINNEKIKLYKKINEVNQEISRYKSLSLKEEGLINKQIYLEEKIKEKNNECQIILEENNKLNFEYNVLNEKYIRLQEKNNNGEKELNELKIKHEEKLNDIEKKMEILIKDINNLKKENNELNKQNENYKSRILEKEKEKNDYYNKCKELKVKNEMIKKENEEIQKKYLENKTLLQKKEDLILIKEKMRKNKSEQKIRVIQDLQKKIQRYKNKRIQKLYSNGDEL